MEIHHIKYFTIAAEELNFSHASRRLNVSQPAMSRLMRDLESELGVSLFVRERFGLRLTPSGEKLLIYTRQILDIINEAVRAVGTMQNANCVLTIGFIASSIGSFLAAALKTFRSANPEVVIKIHELSPASQIKALRKHQIDIALIGNPSGAVLDEFETTVLFELKLAAVIPLSHRLAQRKLINLTELVDDEFIGYNEESFPGRNQTISTACLVAGFKPILSYQADSLGEVLAIVGSGAGVCLMPSDVASLPHPGVKFIPVREKLETIHFTAAWQRDDARSIIRDLLDHIKRQK